MSALPDGPHLAHADEVAPTRWKNGGGVTRELLRVPLPGGAAGDWLLRVSVADIEADGPFSPFDGVSRWFAVLSGHGVELRWPAPGAVPAWRRLTTASAPLAFDGGHAPDCRLVDGATRDLNVMVRDDAAHAVVERASLDSPARGDDAAFAVFALRPLVLVRDGARTPLPARTLAWRAAGDTASWSLAAPAQAPRAIAQTGDGPPPAFWIGLRLRDRGAIPILPTTP